jgi:hypothetical protein
VLGDEPIKFLQQIHFERNPQYDLRKEAMCASSLGKPLDLADFAARRRGQIRPDGTLRASGKALGFF